MVAKRPFKEGDKVSSADLKEKWLETLSFYDEMIKSENKLRPIRFLVRHIIEKGYDKYLYPGTSLFSLLISIPFNDTVDYSKTLQVDIDELRSLVNFRYRDRTGLKRDIANLDESLKWSDNCQLTEAAALFESFISANAEWKILIKNN